MKKKAVHVIVMFVLLSLLTASLGGCRKTEPAEPTGPAVTPIPADTAGTAEPAEKVEPAGTESGSESIGTHETEAVSPGTGLPDSGAKTEKKDGERFEDVIILEGMEETVNYEHLVNRAAGFEMDYDYESFVRQSGPDKERFISVWDDPDNPENYLDVTYSTEDANAVEASVSAELSEEFDLLKSTRELDLAGSCMRIEASEIKGTGHMADQLQAVYIIPAADGCRIATAHYSIESAEGFAKRFFYMVNTLAVIDRNGGAGSTLSEEEALSAVKKYCYSSNPDLEEIVDNGEYPVYWEISSSDEREIVVLFRSYTGAIVRYYIDRASGETYATEFVPGISSGEERTDESINVRDYLD